MWTSELRGRLSARSSRPVYLPTKVARGGGEEGESNTEVPPVFKHLLLAGGWHRGHCMTVSVHERLRAHVNEWKTGSVRGEISAWPLLFFLVARRIRALSSWIRVTEEEGGRTDTEQREVLWGSHNAHVSIVTDCISILLAAQGAHLTLIACTLNCPLTHEIHVGFLSYRLFLLRWPRKAVRPLPPDNCTNLWFTWAAQHLYNIRVFFNDIWFTFCRHLKCYNGMFSQPVKMVWYMYSVFFLHSC